ncbi:hypothetical protein AK812_SmicGene43690 [Symbiodinium microadriaticum]|uniref:Uncharacterized protein n=1 Tax=Symbiodinium microadriaticum TaxID=2951 RepID=A0A1Q9C0C7_SYMMI|nr:hypothetical protein AK812_SmicGene43690 [Symbiodinium microadriaticum]
MLAAESASDFRVMPVQSSVSSTSGGMPSVCPDSVLSFTAKPFSRGRLLEEERWELVYTGWLQILRGHSGGSEIADILEEAQEERAEVACVRQLFGGKALTTLEKRLRQARHYLKWAHETGSEAFPIGNHQVRMYIKQLLKDNAPPSKVLGACEIVNFLAYVVGLPVAVTATKTPWVKGVMRVQVLCYPFLGVTVGARSRAPLEMRRAGCELFFGRLRARLILGHHSENGSAEVYARDVQAAPLRSLEGCLQAIRNSRFYPDMSRSGYLAVDERQDSCLEGSTQSGNLGSADSHALHVAAAAFASLGKQPTEQSVGPASGVNRPTVERSPGPGESFNGDDDSEPRHDDLFHYDSEVGAGYSASLSDDDCGANPNAFQGEVASPTHVAPGPLEDGNEPSDEDSPSSSSSTSSSEAESNPGLPPVPTAPWRDGCVVWQHRRTRTLHLVSVSDSQIGGTFACGRSMKTAHVLASRNAHVASMRCSQCERGKHVRTTGAVLDALEAIKKRRH